MFDWLLISFRSCSHDNCAQESIGQCLKSKDPLKQQQLEVLRRCCNQECGSGSWKRKRWKQSFFCGSGSEKNLSLPFPHRLFDLKSNLAETFCPFPNVDKTVKLHYKSE